MASLIISFIVRILFFHSNPAWAQTAGEKFRSGLKASADKMGYKETGLSPVISKHILAEKIGMIIEVVLSFLGVIFLILMIYGGFTWMLARGNEQEAARAKNIIINAMFGLIIVLAAYTITALVGGQIASVTAP